jgi:hypothetical protein
MEKLYIVKKDWRDVVGNIILKKGIKLKKLYINSWEMYGIDTENRFWTDDFLDNREDVFLKVEYFDEISNH